MIGTLLYVFIALCIVGLILWGCSQIPGIPPIVKTVIYVVVGVILLLWCMQFVGGTGRGFSIQRNSYSVPYAPSGEKLWTT